MSKGFKWTREDVEYLIWQTFGAADVRKMVSDYEASHTPKEEVSNSKDWEIVTIKLHGSSLNVEGHEDWMDKDYKKYAMTNPVILSVRRLSDNEVINVGDVDECIGGIDRIEVAKDGVGGCYAYPKNSNSGINILLIKKPPIKKEPLFSLKEITEAYEKAAPINSPLYHQLFYELTKSKINNK